MLFGNGSTYLNIRNYKVEIKIMKINFVPIASVIRLRRRQKIWVSRRLKRMLHTRFTRFYIGNV